MKFQLPSLLLFVLALIFSASASPISNGQEVGSLAHLAERGVQYPVTPDDNLVVDVLAAVKAHLKVNVFAQISASICEKVQASLSVKAKLLGGIISIDDLQIKAIQSAVVKNLKVRLDATVEADVNAGVHVPLEVTIRKLLGTTPLTKDQLLKILVDIEVQAQALVKVVLPKIAVDLKAKIHEEINVSIKQAQVHIPIIAKVTISVNIDEKATVDVCVDVAAKACLAINPKVQAEIILRGL